MGWLPEGWALVPIEITPEIGHALESNFAECLPPSPVHAANWRDAWKAALAASPSPTPQPTLHAPQFPREEMGRIIDLAEECESPTRAFLGALLAVYEPRGKLQLAADLRAILALIPDQSERIARLEGALREFIESVASTARSSYAQWGHSGEIWNDRVWRQADLDGFEMVQRGLSALSASPSRTPGDKAVHEQRLTSSCSSSGDVGAGVPPADGGG